MSGVTVHLGGVRWGNLERKSSATVEITIIALCLVRFFSVVVFFTMNIVGCRSIRPFVVIGGTKENTLKSI